MDQISSRENQLRKRIKAALAITIIGLLLNGMSAVPLRTELAWLLSVKNILPAFLVEWWTYVNEGVHRTSEMYPFMRYGFDWLGFAHLLIAIAFIGPWRDPLKNQWVVQWGMIASLLSIGMALVWEQIRDIPFWWSLIDATLVLIAFVVLWLCNKWINELKTVTAS